MKRIFAAFMLVGSSTLSTMAADIADLSHVKAPPVQTYSWTGWYAGINVGYGFTDNASNAITPNDGASRFLFPVGGVSTAVAPANLTQSGIVAGMQLGYNWQFASRWLAGIEVDIQGADLTGSGLSTHTNYAFLPGTFVTSDRLEWFGTVRGRLGYLATSDLLLFATGGVAFGSVRNDASYTTPAVISAGTGSVGFFCTQDSVPCFAGSKSETQVGWTLGAGAEWMLWRSLSLKTEYTYINLGNSSYSVVATRGGGSPVLSTMQISRDDMDYHFVRAGLNWHF